MKLNKLWWCPIPLPSPASIKIKNVTNRSVCIMSPQIIRSHCLTSLKEYPIKRWRKLIPPSKLETPLKRRKTAPISTSEPTKLVTDYTVDLTPVCLCKVLNDTINDFNADWLRVSNKFLSQFTYSFNFHVISRKEP